MAKQTIFIYFLQFNPLSLKLLINSNILKSKFFIFIYSTQTKLIIQKPLKYA